MLLFIAKVVLYAVLAVFAAVLWRLYPVILRQFTSPLKNIPGPPSPSWFRGNSKAIEVEDNSVPQERWACEYNSHTITYKGPLSVTSSFNVDIMIYAHFALRADGSAVVYGHKGRQSCVDSLNHISEGSARPSDVGYHSWQGTTIR